jgi:hypothetical protein
LSFLDNFRVYFASCLYRLGEPDGRNKNHLYCALHIINKQLSSFWSLMKTKSNISEKTKIKSGQFCWCFSFEQFLKLGNSPLHCALYNYTVTFATADAPSDSPSRKVKLSRCISTDSHLETATVWHIKLVRANPRWSIYDGDSDESRTWCNAGARRECAAAAADQQSEPVGKIVGKRPKTASGRDRYAMVDALLEGAPIASAFRSNWVSA